MDQASVGTELGFCAWIAFWAQLVVLGGFAVLGAIFASENSAPGDYTCGLLLSLAAIALGFMRVKNRFDGGAADWAGFLLVDDLPSLVAVRRMTGFGSNWDRGFFHRDTSHPSGRRSRSPGDLQSPC